MAGEDRLVGSGDAARPHVAYVDYNASAPIRPEAAAAMLEALRLPGNASSGHLLGRQASELVVRARAELADLLGCTSQELIFTSGATEANNLALRTATPSHGLLIVSAVEHPAVLTTARALADEGSCELAILGVDGDGRVQLPDLQAALESGQPALVSVMAANNETGVINDLIAIGRMVHAAGALLHTDATQLVGRVPLELSAAPIDLLSLSAHKFGGPQGVGALFMRRGLPVAHRPLLQGGGQERGWRAGTLNVAGIAGAGAAAAAAQQHLADEQLRVSRLRDRLEASVLAAVPGARVNGASAPRLPGVTSLTVTGAPADAVLSAMPHVAASDGSACSSGALTRSHVLLAIGHRDEEADCTIRLSLGHATTDAEINFVISELTSAVRRVRAAMYVP
ncbi:cysteine desulfurase family protein [Micromonospora lupini]|uniref:cysteine desulfurase family protein n=1 Tax=Micromonospora lupini TaxID=285679 RepID=UPI00361C7026